MRTRSSRTTEDLVELDFTTGRKRSQRTQRVLAEPEVVVTGAMNDPKGNGNPLGNGFGRSRQTRPIGLGDAPNRHQQRQGIVPPLVQNHNFVVCLTKINGVSEDAMQLRLFPMSLADKAHQWEKSLPHGTITTWHECKKASSHVRPNPLTNIIRPAEPDERTRKLSATIDLTVPIADHNPIAGRTSRPTVRTVFWSILEHMGREEHGRTWCMDAAQLDTQRKKEEAILKTSSTIYSTNRSSSSTRPAKLQLDRAEKSKSNPKNVASPLTFL
ncbi:unnamed protein product [Microthlaspi erraticum]|uniref:Retrotransposon gag domain-containing protein n=1 Tax=Microthlaspi erraticum TaxID=1685480 RepID=A0A6D2K9X3_9BRAS|nr:unnamed protein product [Microthlaspi erraticum]